MPLPRQLTMVVLTAILATTLLSLVALGNIITMEVHKLTDQVLEREVELVSEQLTSQYQEIIDKTELLSDVFVNQLSDLQVNFNQMQLVKGENTPTALLNGDVLNNNFTLVDEFTAITQATATIFILNNSDFIRVSTSLRNLSNERVFGTYLGRSHPGYESLMQGKAYVGKAKLFGKNYMTKYAPVRQNGQTIAVLYIGVAYDSILQQIEQQLSQIKIGDDGFIFIADTAGDERGNILVHPNLAEQNLYKVYPALKNQFDSMFRQEHGLVNYQLPEHVNNPSSVERSVGFKKIPGWDWLLALSLDANEQSSIIRKTIIELSVATILGAVLLSLGIWFFIRKLLSPLKEVTEGLARVGAGDLTVRLSCPYQGRSQNEIDLLKQDIGNMTINLHDLIEKIQKSSEQLLDSSASISDANGLLKARSDEVNDEFMSCRRFFSTLSGPVFTHTPASGSRLPQGLLPLKMLREIVKKCQWLLQIRVKWQSKEMTRSMKLKPVFLVCLTLLAKQKRLFQL